MNKQTKLPKPEVVEANIRANIINVHHPKKEVVSVREAKGDVGLLWKEFLMLKDFNEQLKDGTQPVDN